MKIYSLALQGSYKHLSLALCKNGTVVAEHSEPSFNASAHLLLRIDAVLGEHNLSISDLSYIALDHGPGAFTSLRAMIVTCNAISYAAGVPLIGIDGLDALSMEALQTYQELLLGGGQEFLQKPAYLISVLNAYNQDVFFAINKVAHAGGMSISLSEPKGYCKIDHLIEKLQALGDGDSFLFCGNGAALYVSELREVFGEACFVEGMPAFASAAAISALACEKWEAQEGLVRKILPQYLKTQSFKKKY